MLLAAYAWLSQPLAWPPQGKFLTALAITAAFALVGWLTRGVNISGAFAGFAVALLLAANHLGLFWTLLVVFALTLVATRTRSDFKRDLRASTELAQAALANNATSLSAKNATASAKFSAATASGRVTFRDDGRGRSASQVMANLGVAALIIVLPSPLSVFLALAALAEAAADTCSSELGMAFPGKTVLITTWKPVLPGTDGGITYAGTAAAVLAAAAVAGTARALGLVSTHFAVAIMYAGILGSLTDSILGALFERRGWLNNDAVNLLGTAAAVAIAWVLG